MSRLLVVALVLAIGSGAGLACDRRTAPYVPLDQEPPPPERPVRIPGLASAQPGDAGLEGPLAPAGQRTGALEAPASGLSIQGTLRLPDGARVPSGATLFLIARGQPAGPPLAVRRISPAAFPLDFRIGPEHVMIPGRPFEGPIDLSARVDLDGDPLTREDVVFSARHPSPLEQPADGIELLLEEAGRPAAGSADPEAGR